MFSYCLWHIEYHAAGLTLCTNPGPNVQLWPCINQQGIPIYSTPSSLLHIFHTEWLACKELPDRDERWAFI